MLPSGNYSLRIALASARATINNQQNDDAKYPPLLAIFMAMAVCRYYTVHIA
jgi:hypothetical protein